METHGIAVFDVCGTLTRTNNTSDFIEYVLRRTSLRRYGVFLLIRVLSRLCRVPLIRRRCGRDIWRDRQIALLRGYSCDRIRELARLYVDSLFTQKLWNERVLEAMAQEKERGRTICLVSAAIAPPVAEIAARWGIETCCCSELELAEGRYTGKLETDLLGRKESVLERIAAGADLQNSSVYSDNAEDARFMMRFGTRTAVPNESPTESVPPYKDIHSVNERTVRWVYVPFLYYIISRFHRAGLLSWLLRELIPVTLAGYLATHGDARALGLAPLAFGMFYAIYEIGGLANDLSAPRETLGTGTRRIAPQVRIHVGWFVAARLALVGLLSAMLSLAGYPVGLFLGALAFCLAVYLLHTLIQSHLRMLTFLLLKLCRICLPLTVLAPLLRWETLLYLCAILSLVDVPWRVYFYARYRNMVQASRPTWHIRCANVVLLWLLGALICALYGSLVPLAIASYYVVLELPRMAFR